MIGKHSVKYLESFGDVAAEDDAVLDYFIETEAVGKIDEGRVVVVLGRKGTGKTALVRFFSETDMSGLSRPLNLSSYPWKIHSTVRDKGASDVESYVATWRFLIATQIGGLLLQQPSVQLSASSSNLEKFFSKNYGNANPKLDDMLRPDKLTLEGTDIKPTILGNSLLGVTLKRKSNDLALGSELNALTDAIFEEIKAICFRCKIRTLSLHFDELDIGLSELSPQRDEMIVGLILAARAISREFIVSETSSSEVNIKPVVYLRTDLWEELKFSDKNKISETQVFNLVWNSEALLDLINLRLNKRLNHEANFENICDDDLMRGTQKKWDHLLSRTFLRPRDVIKFLNAALINAKQRKDDFIVFTNKDIVDAREEYSAYLKSELDDEIMPHWPQWSVALQAISALATLNFDADDFEIEYAKRNKTDITPEEALESLFRFSVIGYSLTSGYGGSTWVYKYTDPRANWDNGAKKFKVHPGLKEAARLRESRG